MNEKAQAVCDNVNAKLAKRHKKNAPVLQSGADLRPIEWIPTGLLAFDWTNGGGAPRGRAEQIAGLRSSGKTTIALRRIAEAQRNGLVCVFVDAEHALDKGWAIKIGVNLNDLILYEPETYDSAEMTLGVVIDLLEDNDPPGVIVVDSVPKLCPQKVMDKSMEDKHYAGVSAIMAQFCQKIIGPGILYNSGTNLIFINQPRDVIGALYHTERLPGGRDLGHDSSIITIVRAGDFIFESNDRNAAKIGRNINIINDKNRCRWPYKTSSVALYFASGFNPLLDVLQFADHYGMIEYAENGWANYKGETIGQNRNQHAQWLYQHKDVYVELKNQIRQLILEGK